MSESDVELLTDVLPWTPVELAVHYLILLLKTLTFTNSGIKIDTDLEYLEIKGCFEPLSFRKL